MVIFHSYVSLPEGSHPTWKPKPKTWHAMVVSPRFGARQRLQCLPFGAQPRLVTDGRYGVRQPVTTPYWRKLRSKTGGKTIISLPKKILSMVAALVERHHSLRGIQCS